MTSPTPKAFVICC